MLQPIDLSTDMVLSYHGTNPHDAAVICGGQIDVTLGGGELGQGFYSGTQLWAAKAWAYNRHTRSKSVVMLAVKDNLFFKLNIIILDYRKCTVRYKRLKLTNGTRTYLFRKDVVWAPIVGKFLPYCEQLKWESGSSQLLLNSTNTLRVKI